MSSFFPVFLHLFVNMIRDIMTNMSVFGLKVLAISPLVHLFEEEAITRFERVFSVKSSCHLHWESGSLIVEIENAEASS